MKILYNPKFYKKTCVVTDILAIVTQWVLVLNFEHSFTLLIPVALLGTWVFISGRIFDYIGQKILDERKNNG